MIGGDILLTTAELALALGGFGGVVAAFMGNRDRWDAMAVVRFRALIVISLSSALLSLIPFALYHAGFTDGVLWTTASSIAAAFVAACVIWMVLYARVPAITHGSRSWSLIAMFMASGAVVVNAMNALSLGFSQSFTGYFCALLLLLVLGGLYFFRLIALSGPQSKGSDD